MTQTNPKIAFIGAGSVVFTQGLLADLFVFPELKGAHIALHDIDAERLATAHGAARQIADRLTGQGGGPRITAHAERKAALEGADFVINIVQVGMRESTRVDFDVPAATASARPSGTPSASEASSARCAPSHCSRRWARTSPRSAPTPGC